MKYKGFKCEFFGRATQALVCILSSIKEQHSIEFVYIPAICCPSVLFAVRFAGLKPILVEVDASTGLLDVTKIGQRAKDKPSAIIFVELYGQTQETKKVVKTAKELGFFSILDAALSNAYVERDFSFCDCVVFSFGNKKQISIGFGAMLLTASSFNFGNSELVKNYSSMRQALETILYPKLYWFQKRIKPAFLRILFGRLMHHLVRSKFLSLNSRLAVLPEKLNAVERQRDVDIRLRRTKEFCELFANLTNIQLITFCSSDVYWRFSFLIHDKNKREKLLRDLRIAGHHASSWYGPLTDYCSKQEKCLGPFPAAEDFSSRVVNLWLIDELDIICSPLQIADVVKATLA